jgi:hypothetical protein
MARPAATPSLGHRAAMEDPRRQAKVLHPLPGILLLPPCATLAGADDPVGTEFRGEGHLAFPRRILLCRHGVPSHDKLGAALDPGLFKACFATRVEGLR